MNNKCTNGMLKNSLMYDYGNNHMVMIILLLAEVSSTSTGRNMEI